MSSGLRSWLSGPISGPVLLAIVRRPALWPEAVRALRRLRPNGPASGDRIPTDYLRFRSQTSSGGDGSHIDPKEIVDWLKWTRSFRRVVE